LPRLHPYLLLLNEDSFDRLVPQLLDSFRREDNRTTSSSSIKFRLAMEFPLLRLMHSSEGFRRPIDSSTIMVSNSRWVSIDDSICSNFSGSTNRNFWTISSSLYSHPSSAN
jgi:hypothetical protein